MSNSGRLRIAPALLLKNAALSLGGDLALAIIALVTLPILLRHMGSARFGVFSLVWLVLAYFTIADLGLGRAIVRFVSKMLGENKGDQVPRLIWTAISALAILGAAGGALLAGLTPLLVGRVLNIPQSLVPEAREALFILSGSLPFVLVAVGLRGVLESVQRFDLINLVKVPLVASSFVLAAIGAGFGMALPGIVWILVMGRAASAAAYLMLCLRVFPGLSRPARPAPGLLRPLLFYGGWTSMANAGSGMISYMDRFFIAALLPIGAVAHYALPFDLVNQLGVLSVSLLAVTFPAVSALEGARQHHAIEVLVSRHIKYLVLVMGVAVTILVAFAYDGLQWWLGMDFAAASAVALQLLAIGILSASLAGVLGSLLQGVGRADLPAKMLLVEFPLYVTALWLLIPRLGINGAALVWAARFTCDGIVLLILCLRLGLLSRRGMASAGVWRGVAAIALLGCCVAAGVILVEALVWRVALMAGLLVALAALVWLWVTDAWERQNLVAWPTLAARLLGRGSR